MEITSGATPEEAVKLAGLPADSAPALMSNPAVKREIDLALGRQGIDEDYFAGKLKELCEACNSKGDPDWSARSKGLGMLKDIYGHDAPKNAGETKTTWTYEERLLMLANEEVPATVRVVQEIECHQP
jgi:hypothetical protein